MFTLGSFFENYRSSADFGGFFFHATYNYDKKMDWATFWAIFVTTSSGHPDLEALALVFI
jgi:hypothetical protein